MAIALEPQKRARVVARLQLLFSKEFDEKLSDFQANAVVDLMLKRLGPAVYNQAVQDVRAHMQVKLDDLDGEVFADGDT